MELDRPLRVLVVDDVIDVAESIATFLRMYTFQVRVAYGVTGALEAVWSLPPDVLLIDLRMPEVDGAQLASTLMHLAGMHEARLIFMSGDASYRASALPPHHAFLKKPFEMECVLESISTAMNPLRNGRVSAMRCVHRSPIRRAGLGFSAAGALVSLPGWSLAVTWNLRRCRSRRATR